MKKNRIYICLLSVVMASLIFCASSYASDILDIGAGARSIGLGRAYNAVTADGYSIFANPAGLGGLTTIEMVSMYGELSGDVKYTMVGALFPLKFGVLGFGYAGSKSGDIFLTTVEATGRIGSVSNVNWANETYLISYGNKYKNKLTYGATLKYYKKGADQVALASGTGANIDAGLTYNVDKRLTLALMAKNLLPGAIGAIRWANGYYEEQPLEIRAGLLFKPKTNLNLLFDINSKYGYPAEGHLGLEWFLRDKLALRFGAEQLASGDYSRYVNYSAGVGIGIGPVTIDYAYYYDSNLQYNSRHFVSLTVGLPGTKETKQPEKVIEKPVVKVFVEKPSFESIAIYDVPDSYWASKAIQYLVYKKVFSVFKDGQFRPDRPIIRADLATIILKAKYQGAPWPDIKIETFKDVPPKYWARKAIGTVAALDLMKGYPSGNFRPNGKVAFLDGVLTCVRIGNLPLEPATSAVYENIPADHPAARQIKAAKDAGLLDAIVKNNIFPITEPLTRAQLSWMLYRLDNI